MQRIFPSGESINHWIKFPKCRIHRPIFNDMVLIRRGLSLFAGASSDSGGPWAWRQMCRRTLIAIMGVLAPVPHWCGVVFFVVLQPADSLAIMQFIICTSFTHPWSSDLMFNRLLHICSTTHNMPPPPHGFGDNRLVVTLPYSCLSHSRTLETDTVSFSWGARIL